MPSKRKRNPIENLLGYTKREEKREDNNNTLEEKENVGTYCKSILRHFHNTRIEEKGSFSAESALTLSNSSFVFTESRQSLAEIMFRICLLTHQQLAFPCKKRRPK